jgi:hypothetical protein
VEDPLADQPFVKLPRGRRGAAILTFKGSGTLRFGAGHQGRIRVLSDVPDFSRGAEWRSQGDSLDTDSKEVHQP